MILGISIRHRVHYGGFKSIAITIIFNKKTDYDYVSLYAIWFTITRLITIFFNSLLQLRLE